MTMRYFSLLSDYDTPNPWRLADPVDAQGKELRNPFIFTKGKPVSLEGRLKVPLAAPGKAFDFSLAGDGSTPILHERLAKLVAQLAPDDVQLLPADVEGQTEPYAILVATKTVQCVDEPNCVEVTHWPSEGRYKSMAGQYKSIHGLRIDPAKVGQLQVFRPWGWTVALIVSENIQQKLAFSGLTGLEFQEVTGPKEARTE